LGLADNVAVVHRYLSVAQDYLGGADNLDALDEIFAADYISHSADGKAEHGPAKMREFLIGVRDFLTRAGATLAIDEVIADGEMVAVHLTFTAPGPAGEPVAVPEMQIYRIADGMIRERWFVPDQEAVQRWAVH
jgi:predicted SnoaL-like aldol condensation-catalyzing enzyme